MNKLKYILFLPLLLPAFSARSQRIDTAATEAYIQQYKDIAITEMKRVGIPASITLAQGIHESGLGKSYLAQNTNNHFGIKCHENWTGKTFSYTDDAPDECFRVYDSPEESYRDHSDFLANRPRYAPLFLFAANDYKAWAYGLKKAGYATNPRYPDILIKTIEDFQLYLFDKGENPSYVSSNPSAVPSPVEKEEQEEFMVTDSMDINIPKSNAGDNTDDEPRMDAEIRKPEFYIPSHKKIIKINKCKAVKIYKGETLELIGSILSISNEDLLSFNDIHDASAISAGQVLFIQRKKKKNKEGTYKVRTDDNMWSISQKKGIQLSALLNRNKLAAGEEPAPKEMIYLKGNAREKPKLRPKTEPKREVVKTPDVPAVPAKNITPPVIAVPSKSTIDSSQLPGGFETKLAEKPAPVFPAKDTITPKGIIPVETPKPGAITENVDFSTQPIVKDEPKTVYPAAIDYAKLPKSTTGSHTVIKGDTLYNICKRYNISISQIIEWNNLSDQNIKLGQVLKIQP